MGRILEAARESEIRNSILRSWKSTWRSLEANTLKLIAKFKESKLFRGPKVFISWLVLLGLGLFLLLALTGLGLPLNLMFDLVSKLGGLLVGTIVDLGFVLGVLVLLILLLVVLSGLVWSLRKSLLKTLFVLIGLVVLYILFGPGVDLVFAPLVFGGEFELGLLGEKIVPWIKELDSSLVEKLPLPSSQGEPPFTPKELAAKELEHFLGASILLLILFLILLVPLLVVLSSLVHSLRRMFRFDRSPEVWKKRRAEFFKGLVPPLLFSIAIALPFSLIIGLIRYLGPGLFGSPAAIPGLIAITVGLFIGFGVPWLLPATWSRTESLWWRLSFGGSTAARMLRDHAIKDFRLSISQRQTDEGLQPSIAFLRALGARIFQFPYLHCDAKRMKDEKEKLAANNAIRKLSEEWKSGGAPELLRDYMEDIMRSSKGKDDRQRLRARCAVANVKYLLGDLDEASALAEKNWQRASKLEKEAKNQQKADDEDSAPQWESTIPKWWASYAYFGSTSLFLGKFEKGMTDMFQHWKECYEEIDRSDPPGPEERERKRKAIIDELSRGTLINPVMAIPRLLILVAAFNGSPKYDKEKEQYCHWPEEARDDPSPDKLKSELKWVRCWYGKAKEICANEPISLDFSHAYAGFYFTLLCLDDRYAGDRNLREEALEALNNIEGSSLVTRYVKSGFSGIYKLAIEEDPRGAREDFREAARYSDFSGNKFAIIDCLFMCCRAVAAQKTGPHLELEADRYLEEAGKVAEKIGSSFYLDLHDAARYEVSRLRVSRSTDEDRAQRFQRIDAKLRRSDKRFRSRGRAGNRILRVFRKAQPTHEPQGPLQALRSMILRLQSTKEVPNASLDGTIENLNKGWELGVAPELLRYYMEAIMRSSKDVDTWRRLRARCAVASVRYLLGDIREANELAGKNWQLATKPEVEAKDKWRASYAYFNTRALGLGEFEPAMELMAEHWDKYYVSLPEGERKEIICESYGLVVNPAMSTPRNLILAAAFNESPIAAAFDGSPTDKKQYWPSVAREDWRGELKRDFRRLDPNKLESELEWVECWYEEAKEICANDPVSLVFSHVCAGFYFTLLSLDSKCGKAKKEGLRGKAEEAFKEIDIIEETLSVEPSAGLRYAKLGFHGVYKLVIEEDPEEALKCLRNATRLSEMSGNRFAVADCLFVCCRAVAAQRTGPYLEVEADSYLEEAEKAAEKIGASFYFDLYDAARSEVSRLRGNEGETTRIDAKLRRGQAGERILRVFRKNFQKYER